MGAAHSRLPPQSQKEIPCAIKEACKRVGVKMEKNIEGFFTDYTTGMLHAGLLISGGLTAGIAALGVLF